MNETDRRAALTAAMAARLRPLCADWPEDLFMAMIDRLTDITLKYEGRSGSTYDRRSTDVLVSELKAALERSESARDTPDQGSASLAVALLLPVLAEVVGNIPLRIT
jgi:hypothetical protein